MRFLADENFDDAILQGLIRRVPVDIVRAVRVGLSGRPDPQVLQWAAQERRVLLTQDHRSMLAYAWQRVEQSLPMPGVCVVPQSVPISIAIDELTLIAECSRDEDWDARVRFVPI